MFGTIQNTFEQWAASSLFSVFLLFTSVLFGGNFEINRFWKSSFRFIEELSGMYRKYLHPYPHSCLCTCKPSQLSAVPTKMLHLYRSWMYTFGSLEFTLMLCILWVKTNVRQQYPGLQHHIESLCCPKVIFTLCIHLSLPSNP